MHGLSVKSHTQGVFDWEVAASLYDYDKDHKRQNAAANTLPGAASGGAGTLPTAAARGWNTLALQGHLAARGPARARTSSTSACSRTASSCAYLTSNDRRATGSPMRPGALASDVGGRTRLRSLWAQDAWALRAALEGRAGRARRALEGQRTAAPRSAPPAVDTAWPERSESTSRPRRRCPGSGGRDTVLKASLGRAVRFPTVGELYGATSTANCAVHQRPEPAAREILDRRAQRREGPGQRPAAPDAVRRGHARCAVHADHLRSGRQPQRQPRAERRPRRTHGLELAYNGSDVLQRTGWTWAAASPTPIR